jgi:hypothetical protein
LSLDYVARQKVGGTSLTYFYLRQLSVLPPSAYGQAELDFIEPRVLELAYTSHALKPFADDLGYDRPPFSWDPNRRAALKAELDAYFAYLCGLSRDELRYILDPKEVMGADYPSETLVEDGHTKRGGRWRQQSSGIHWFLLAPTLEFEQVMKRFGIPENFWPFTIANAFPAALAARPWPTAPSRRGGRHPSLLSRRHRHREQGACQRPPARPRRRRCRAPFPPACSRDEARLRRVGRCP